MSRNMPIVTIIARQLWMISAASLAFCSWVVAGPQWRLDAPAARRAAPRIIAQARAKFAGRAVGQGMRPTCHWDPGDGCKAPPWVSASFKPAEVGRKPNLIRDHKPEAALDRVHANASVLDLHEPAAT